MMNENEIAAALLDDDGTFRDITCKAGSWDAVIRLLQDVRTHYSKIRGTRSPMGEDVSDALARGDIAAALPPEPDGYVHIVAEDHSNMIPHLQVYIGRNDDDVPFVELSYFPGDIRELNDFLSRFRKLADHWAEFLQTTEYFVRYENVSWQFGDCGENSGVIFVGPTSRC